MATKVIVTEEHIRGGVPGSIYYCPLALALRSAFGTGCVCAGTTYAWVRGNRARFPESALDFQAQFDSRERVSPFEFFLDLDL